MQEKTSKERTDILANRPRSFSEYPATLGVDEKSPWRASPSGKKGVLENSGPPAQARNAQRLRVRRLQHTGKLRRCLRSSSQRALFFSRDSGRDPKGLECLWGLERVRLCHLQNRPDNIVHIGITHGRKNRKRENFFVGAFGFRTISWSGSKLRPIEGM